MVKESSSLLFVLIFTALSSFSPNLHLGVHAGKLEWGFFGGGGGGWPRQIYDDRETILDPLNTHHI